MKTLENWFLPKESFDIDRRYFYLEWKHNGNRPNKVEWCKKLPPNCNVVKKITLRGSMQITVCGKIFNNGDDDPFQDIESSFEFKNKSLLKSHLQKCIRRKLECKAIRTAYYHMKRDMSDFLRRLPIIMLEDTCLHSSVNVIIWFMCVNDIINYQNYMIWYFLGIVHYISVSDNCDGIEKNSFTSKTDIIQLWNKIEKLPSNIRNMLYSLTVRYSYGGMKGDEKLIIDNINFYLEKKIYITRFEDKIRPVQINRTIYINEFEISAVDFHCFPMIIGEIRKQYKEYTEDEIKKAIWYNSSSINKRKINNIDDNNKQIWNTIKYHFNTVAKSMLVSF